MSLADKIAIRVKAQRLLLPAASMIVMGRREWEAVNHNPDPCDPPDLDPDGKKFCGVPVFASSLPTQLSLVLDVP